MAVDSIIARPTNKVRVMVAEASGCCASAVRAVETDRPSPNAGHIQPTPVVRPAVTIEAIATRVLLSMMCPLAVSFLVQVAGTNSGLANPGLGLRERVAA